MWCVSSWHLPYDKKNNSFMPTDKQKELEFYFVMLLFIACHYQSVCAFLCISVCCLSMVDLQLHGNIATQNLYMTPQMIYKGLLICYVRCLLLFIMCCYQLLCVPLLLVFQGKNKLPRYLLGNIMAELHVCQTYIHIYNV